MPDETPIVGVEGSTEPPIISPSQSTDLDHRRKNRFGGESRKGGLGIQPRMEESAPAQQEESGEPARQDSPKAESAVVDEEAPPPRRNRFRTAEVPTPQSWKNDPQTPQVFGDSDNLSSSTLLTSMPHTAKASLLAIRKWHQVPDETTDDALLATIDPNMIALIMQIIQQVIACIPNHKQMGWSRVVNYANAKPMERLGDNLRLNSMINKWADALAIPREAGDVVMIRESLTQAAASLKMEEFTQVQTEVLFLTI